MTNGERNTGADSSAIRSSSVVRRPPAGRATVLLTGASGLVGSELLRTLAADGVAIRALDRHPPPAAATGEWVTGDLRDPEVCRRACDGVDAVVHNAAVQYHDGAPPWRRVRFFEQNVEAMRALADAARRAGVRRFVFVSSDMAYGLPERSPVLETDPANPIGPYGRSKLACERIAESCRRAGMIVTILRPRLIVGPGRLGVLTRLFTQVHRGGAIPLIGDGRNRYQMVAVSDVAAACRLALHRDADGLYNLGSSDPPTVAELLSELCRRAGKRVRLLRMPSRPVRAALRLLDGFGLSPLCPEQYRIADRDIVLDTTAARTALGWTPVHNDVEMLWQAYRAWLDSVGAGLVVKERAAPVLPPSRERRRAPRPDDVAGTAPRRP